MENRQTERQTDREKTDRQKTGKKGEIEDVVTIRISTVSLNIAILLKIMSSKLL